MAPSGLNGRLARLAAKVDDLAFRQMARRVANGSGGSVAEAEAELRAFFRILRARYGSLCWLVYSACPEVAVRPLCWQRH